MRKSLSATAKLLMGVMAGIDARMVTDDNLATAIALASIPAF